MVNRFSGLILSFMIVFLGACKKDDVSPPTPETNPATIVLGTDSSSFSVQSITPDMIILRSLSGNESLTTGSILVSGITTIAPNGFLRKVDSLFVDNGEVIAYTSRATLREAIETGEGSFQKTFTSDDVRSMGEPFVLDEQLTFGNNLDVNVYAEFTPTLSAGFEILEQNILEDTWGIVLVDFSVNGEMQIEIMGDVEGALSQQIDVLSFELNPIVFQVGPVPIVIRPVFSIDLRAEAEFVGTVTCSYERSFDITRKLVHSSGEWSTVATQTFEDSEIDVQISESGQVRAGIIASIDLALYDDDFMSIGIEAEAYGQVDFGLESAPPLAYWNFYAGIDATSYFVADVFGGNLANESFTFPLYHTWVTGEEVLLNQVVLTYPENGSTNVSFEGIEGLVLEWEQYMDPIIDVGSIGYHVFFGTTPALDQWLVLTPPGNFSQEITGSSWWSTVDNPGGTVYWKIVARDGPGNELAESDVWSFTLAE